MRFGWDTRPLLEVSTMKAGAGKLFDLNGFDAFRQPAASIDEGMAREFTALACKILRAMGAYTMSQRNLRTYFLLDSVNGPR